MKYTDKWKDPRWQKKRLEIFTRDEWRCQSCGSITETLCVHHFEYHGNPWDAPNDALVTLCESCHGDETDHRKGCEEEFLRWFRKRRFLCGDLEEISNGLEYLEKHEKISTHDLSILLSIVCIYRDVQKELWNSRYAEVPEQLIDE